MTDPDTVSLHLFPNGGKPSHDQSDKQGVCLQGKMLKGRGDHKGKARKRNHHADTDGHHKLQIFLKL